MSRTTMALIFKFVLTFIMAWIAFGVLDGNLLTYILVVAVLGTGLNYVIGDLLVLPSFGNIIASIGDGGMAAITALLVSAFIFEFRTSATSLIVFAVLIALGEYFFHMYLKSDKKVAP